MLYRRFEHTDVKPLLDAADMEGVVLVQAAPTAAETDYLLGIADAVPWVQGVVGWVDLDAPDATDSIARRAQHPKFVGIRPMLQDIADPRWILAPSRARALEAMAHHRVVFDALIRPVHMDVIEQLASRYPRLDIVIDHAAKPRIGPRLDPIWELGMRRLSRFSNVACKLSGLMTELSPGTDAAMIERHVEMLLTTFNSDNLIWGSDWPVLTTAATYSEWFDLSQHCLAKLNQHDPQAVLGGNATRIYGLGVRA
jgi:L-fuconolactonase